LFDYLQVKLQDGCPIPSTDMCWSTHYYPIAKAWTSPYISHMQVFTQLMMKIYLAEFKRGGELNFKRFLSI